MTAADSMERIVLVSNVLAPQIGTDMPIEPNRVSDMSILLTIQLLIW